MFRFEKLDVWQRAVDFSDRIYVVTRGFPAEERFGLSNQMRRASVSISSNIAEGTGRSSNKDFAHFVEVGYSSLMEAVSQTQVAFRQSFLTDGDRGALYASAEELARMLSGLRASLLR